MHLLIDQETGNKLEVFSTFFLNSLQHGLVLSLLGSASTYFFKISRKDEDTVLGVQICSQILKDIGQVLCQIPSCGAHCTLKAASSWSLGS